MDPKKIDLANIDPNSYENLDELIKILVEREKLRLSSDEQTAHANDHRSSHSNAAIV